MSQIYSPDATGLTTLMLFFWAGASVKRVPGETFESPSGYPATVLIGLKGSRFQRCLIDDVGVNATSVHKSAFHGYFFLMRRLVP
jgi:hypothetical protein